MFATAAACQMLRDWLTFLPRCPRRGASSSLEPSAPAVAEFGSPRSIGGAADSSESGPPVGPAILEDPDSDPRSELCFLAEWAVYYGLRR